MERKGEHMKISTKGRYGLRAFVDLAIHSEEMPISISSISGRQDISEKYLEQLMTLLKRAGLVKSIRGAGGGYQLAKPANKISVGDVLRALEGNLEPASCAAFHDGEICRTESVCVTKHVWKKINESINNTVNQILISTLVEEGRAVGKERKHE